MLVEQKLDFSRFVPDGFGTGDCLIIADSELQVIDFKYGTGVQVEAENNPQMMCYALGAMLLYDGIYDIDSVKMTIFQPRKDHVSSAIISKDDLYSWAVDVLHPIAEIAAKGEGDFKAGDHCRFCKIKAACRKRGRLMFFTPSQKSLLKAKEISRLATTAASAKSKPPAANGLNTTWNWPNMISSQRMNWMKSRLRPFSKKQIAFLPGFPM